MVLYEHAREDAHFEGCVFDSLIHAVELFEFWLLGGGGAGLSLTAASQE